jgi:hypothetical protein
MWTITCSKELIHISTSFHANDKVVDSLSEENSQFLVGFERVIYNLSIICNHVKYIIIWGYLHFEENLISLDLAHTFHSIWIKELDHRNIFFLFIQENQLVSFLVVLDIL